MQGKNNRCSLCHGTILHLVFSAALLTAGAPIGALAYDDALPWRYDTSSQPSDVRGDGSGVNIETVSSVAWSLHLSMPAEYLFSIFDSRDGDMEASPALSLAFIKPGTVVLFR